MVLVAMITTVIVKLILPTIVPMIKFTVTNLVDVQIYLVKTVMDWIFAVILNLQMYVKLFVRNQVS